MTKPMPMPPNPPTPSKGLVASVVDWLEKLWEPEFLRNQVILAAVATATLFVACEYLGFRDGIDSYTQNLKDVYVALSAIFGALLGFNVAALAILLGYWSSEKLSKIRESGHSQDLWRIFTSASRWLAGATLVSIVGIVVSINPAHKPVSPILYVTFFFTFVSALRLLRCVWIVEEIVWIVTDPEKQAKPRPERKRKKFPLREAEEAEKTPPTPGEGSKM